MSLHETSFVSSHATRELANGAALELGAYSKMSDQAHVHAFACPVAHPLQSNATSTGVSGVTKLPRPARKRNIGLLWSRNC